MCAIICVDILFSVSAIYFMTSQLYFLKVATKRLKRQQFFIEGFAYFAEHTDLFATAASVVCSLFFKSRPFKRGRRLKRGQNKLDVSDPRMLSPTKDERKQQRVPPFDATHKNNLCIFDGFYPNACRKIFWPVTLFWRLYKPRSEKNNLVVLAFPLSLLAIAYTQLWSWHLYGD